jgi:hypothetical protein
MINQKNYSQNPFRESKITFRSVEIDDRDRLLLLHNELFPVGYTTKFFDDVCLGIGMHGGEITPYIQMLELFE